MSETKSCYSCYFWQADKHVLKCRSPFLCGLNLEHWEPKDSPMHKPADKTKDPCDTCRFDSHVWHGSLSDRPCGSCDDNDSGWAPRYETIPLTPENVKPGIEFVKTPVEVMPMPSLKQDGELMLTEQVQRMDRRAAAKWILEHPTATAEGVWIKFSVHEYEQLKKIAEGN